MLSILHISDTHGLHRKLMDMPAADVLVHSGDISNSGTEAEVLDFINWLSELPFKYKLFVCGNNDCCLWDAEDIEDLPDGIHFLQDRSIKINGVVFSGIGYDHSVDKIDPKADVVITHEPPTMILDYSSGTHWGNIKIRKRVEEIKPRFHLFGHTHESYGLQIIGATRYSNASLLNDKLELVNKPRALLGFPTGIMGRMAIKYVEEKILNNDKHNGK